MCFQKNGFAGKVVLGKEKCERMSRVVKMVGGGGDKDGRRSILILGAQTQGHPRHPPLVGTHQHTAARTQIWVDAPLAGVSFLRVFGVHLLSWLVNTDPCRPTPWSCLEKRYVLELFEN